MRCFLLLAVLSGCSSIAVSMAPKKQNKPDDRAFAKVTTDEFWKVFHGGQYDAIGPLLEKHKQVYLTHPYEGIRDSKRKTGREPPHQALSSGVYRFT
jgi:hypothetical protein